MQVYIKLDADIAKWYQSLPPRGKSEAINAVLRAGLEREGFKDSRILQELAAIKQMIADLPTLTASPEAEPQGDFFLDGLQSIAVIED